MSKIESKKNWTLNADAFQRLLEWFDGGKNSDGRNYLEIRQRLVSYFDRKSCLNPDELADETLNRVARRLAEEKIETETPAKFCYITARFVFLESLRNRDKKSVAFDEIESKVSDNQTEKEETEIKEKRLDCLEKCVAQLETKNRELIVGYYYGTERVKIENRRVLAEKLGVSANALSIRACRIRDKLEICVNKCVKEK